VPDSHHRGSMCEAHGQVAYEQYERDEADAGYTDKFQEKDTLKMRGRGVPKEETCRGVPELFIRRIMSRADSHHNPPVP
jgi:hypothetical protein